MKKIVALFLVLCLILPQAAFANEATVPAWNFSDTATHWGKKHISKLALLGITSGKGEGKFAPGDTLTQQETVTFLINMMGLQNERDMDTEAVLPFEISPWAKSYVVLALSKKLINMQEELQRVTGGELSSSWGTAPASREWVTKLIIRSIAQESAAASLHNSATGFSDEAQISDGYIGYVNLAKSLQIVSGNTDGTFNPKGSVTRAEMAVFIGNAEKHLTKRSEQIISGTVLSASSSSITLQTAIGAKTLTVASGAGFYTSESNNAIASSSIVTGDYVNVIQYQNIAYFVEKSNAIAPPVVNYETITGELVNISQPSQTIVITVNNVAKSYPFASNMTITSATGAGMSSTSLVPGSLLELKREAGNDNGNIISIVVKQLTELKTVSGTVERIIAGTNLVEVKDAASGDKAIYEILSTVKITSGTRELSGVSDLHIGDEVTTSLKDGVVTAFTVTKSVITAIEGKVATVDAGINNINLFDENNTTKGYFVELNAIVQISGMNVASLKDIQKDDEVILELNATNKVQKIVVKNRTIEAKILMNFQEFYPDSNYILFNPTGSKPELMEIQPDTVITFNSNVISRADINKHFTKGTKIDLIFSGDRIVRMSNSSKYTGKVTEIVPLSNTIRINSDEYGSMSFAYAQVPFVELFGKSSTSLSDVRIGDQVQLMLDTTQTKVQHIQITQKKLYKVTNKLTYKLTVVDERGISYDINNVSTAVVSHYDKLYATYNDVTVGSYVMVTFTGSSPSSIYIPKLSYGTVDSVDFTQNTFNYSEHGKASRSITGNTSIIMNGSTQLTVNGLAAGDRIMLVESNDGVRLINKLTKLEKKLISYNTTGHTVDFYITLITDTKRYSLDPNVYIHKGAETLTTTALVKDSSYNVYLYNNIIMELEKK
jgi:hypothetical protein